MMGRSRQHILSIAAALVEQFVVRLCIANMAMARLLLMLRFVRGGCFAAGVVDLEREYSFTIVCHHGGGTLQQKLLAEIVALGRRVPEFRVIFG